VTKIKFDNNYPEVDSLGLFSYRHEINHIFQGRAEKILTDLILKSFPGSEVKNEIIATTYFERILSYEPQKSCIVRFRQRAIAKPGTKLAYSKYWHLSGSGNLEVKIRSVSNREKVTKMGTFLTDEPGFNIYSLLELDKNTISPANRNKFITGLNTRQVKTIPTKNLKDFHFLSPRVFENIAGILKPYATRVNLRKTFHIKGPQKARITLETQPVFYIYPINQTVHSNGKSKPGYKGYLTEQPDRCKVEIKSSNKPFCVSIEKIFGLIIKKYGIFQDKYTEKPYYKMVLDISQKAGTLINEYPKQEIEVKAGFSRHVNIAKLMEIIRNKLLMLKTENSPYKLFPTDPDIKIRGQNESGRTLVGWQDGRGKWHEVVTAIRFIHSGITDHGIPVVLKWKTDNQNGKSDVLNRGEKIEYLKKDIPDDLLIQRADKISGRKTRIVGIMKKLKYRIHVQDQNGRIFVLSLDESRPVGSKAELQQLEVEYVHTVVNGINNRSIGLVSESCDKCMDYFIKILADLGLKLTKTQYRKIDFLGSNSRIGPSALNKT